MISDLDARFEDAFKINFDFLIEKYGFEYMGLMSVPVVAKSYYRSKNVEVAAYMDKREDHVEVCVGHLRNGKIVESQSVFWLLEEFEPDTEIRSKLLSDFGQSMDEKLSRYRDVLLKYGHQVLTGDLKILKKMSEKIKKKIDEHPEKYFPLAKGETIADLRTRLAEAKRFVARIKKKHLR